MNTIKKIAKGLVKFYLLLLLFVIPHELGHLVVARSYNIPVKEFSVGFGKLLAQTHVGGMDWSFRLIPLGGYVNIDFTQKIPYWNEMAILVAGSLVNIVMGIALFRRYRKLAISILRIGIFNLTPILFITDGAQMIRLTLHQVGASGGVAATVLLVTSFISFFVWIVS